MHRGGVAAGVVEDGECGCRQGLSAEQGGVGVLSVLGRVKERPARLDEEISSKSNGCSENIIPHSADSTGPASGDPVEIL